MAADGADEENLKAAIFKKGEWGDMPIPLAMDYEMVAETLDTSTSTRFSSQVHPEVPGDTPLPSRVVRRPSTGANGLPRNHRRRSSLLQKP